MATIGGRDNFGLFTNGDFRDGTVGQFNFGTFSKAQSFDGLGCVTVTGGNGSTYLGSQFLEVDTSKTYQMITYAKTIARGSTNNDLAGGHIGFACYDKNKTFVDLTNCGGLGNTTLSRAASPGDSIIYLTSNSGWYTGADVTNQRAYFRILQFFPASHPDYGTAHEYTRFNNRSYYRMEQTAQGDWAVYIDANTSSQFNTYTPSTLPNYGYSLPAGTPVSRGSAGGTFNYALGAPNYPEGTWTRYATPPFTGESRNSGYPFRYATKYIKFMILRNYNNRNDSPQDHQWALDRIFFGQCLNGRDYRDSL